MQAFDPPDDTPPELDDFAVDWSAAVLAATPVPESHHPYLEAIARYSNNEDGIFALELRLADDPTLTRLLAAAHEHPAMARELVPRLLARSRAARALTAFAPDPDTLERGLHEPGFAWRDPSAVLGELTDYLYNYGMYQHFSEHHDRDAALALAAALVRATVQSPEALLAFDVWGPWGAWFDPHSCSDRSFLLIDRQRRSGLLLCFSHSD
jgi:hypothetical protein